MGTSEASTPTKSPKRVSSTQEVSQTPSTPAYADWANSVQALYGAAAAPHFFSPNVASPVPHPYLWGGQHPLMAPYGTPVPYPPVYAPGGVYAHPNMTLAPGGVHGISEPETKVSEGKEPARKKSKRASGSHALKSGDGGNTASGSGNDVATISAESGSEDSSGGSDNNDQEQEHGAPKKGRFEQMLADGASSWNNGVPTNYQAGVPGSAVVPVPATNLNIGMDAWNASTGSMNLHSNPPGVTAAVARSGPVSDQRIQDERELKRQKRKLSNRESARRSRLRKQAECEELQQRVEALTNENRTLRDELRRLSEECGKLESQNTSIKEELTRLCGSEAMPNLERSRSPSPENGGNNS